MALCSLVSQLTLLLLLLLLDKGSVLIKLFNSGNLSSFSFFSSFITGILLYGFILFFGISFNFFELSSVNVTHFDKGLWIVVIISCVGIFSFLEIWIGLFVIGFLNSSFGLSNLSILYSI